jgi:hypothetical protein
MVGYINGFTGEKLSNCSSRGKAAKNEHIHWVTDE